MKIYLASGSPRRRELLTQIGIEYEVKVSKANEDADIAEPACLVEELSKRKACAVYEELISSGERTDFAVIGADTVVSIDGKVLGKPCNEEEAVLMLKSLSGRAHEVYTGVTVLVNRAGKLEQKTFNECTRVTFFKMTEAEIKEYVATKDPLDKAGAYGIQGFCARYIEKIDGDYNNVVGLPIGRLYQEMKGLV